MLIHFNLKYFVFINHYYLKSLEWLKAKLPESTMKLTTSTIYLTTNVNNEIMNKINNSLFPLTKLHLNRIGQMQFINEP